MFCPKCGTNIEKERTCLSCGEVVPVDIQEFVSEEKENKGMHESSQVKEQNSAFKKITFIGLAIAVLVMFFSGASSIAEGGRNIMAIQSVGGTTLEEAYYFRLGYMYSGYATIVRATGVFFASILASLGFKN